MKVKTDGFNKLVQFGLSDEMIRLAQSPNPVAVQYRGSERNTKRFTATESMDEAVALSRKGWPEGLKEVQRMRLGLEDLVSGLVPVPEPRYGQIGHVVHIGRYLAGRPDCMIELVDRGQTRETVRPKILRLVCNITSSCAVGEQTILRRGAAMIALVQTLARFRIRCSIDLSMAITTKVDESGDKLEYTLRIKHEQEHVNMDRLAFFMAHPSALRRIGMAIMEHENEDMRSHYGIGIDKGGYGLPCSSSYRGDIYLDKIITTADWSEAFTIAWLKKSLAAQGISLSAEKSV